MSKSPKSQGFSCVKHSQWDTEYLFSCLATSPVKQVQLFHRWPHRQKTRETPHTVPGQHTPVSRTLTQTKQQPHLRTPGLRHPEMRSNTCSGKLHHVFKARGRTVLINQVLWDIHYTTNDMAAHPLQFEEICLQVD